MGGRISLWIAVFGAAALSAAGCGGDDEFSGGGDYAGCEEGTIVDYSENQKVVCDDLKAGVEELCGFDLTVDACTCAAQLGACVGDTDWLQAILDCRASASDCSGYIACLGTVGTSPSGCTDPTTWDCIVSASDTDPQ